MGGVGTLVGPHRLVHTLHKALNGPLQQQGPDNQDGQDPPPSWTPKCTQSGAHGRQE